MTRMAESFFAASPLLLLPVLSLLVFFAVFVIVTVRTLKTPAATLDSRASLPLEEENHG